MSSNSDPVVVKTFGQEWKKFSHTKTAELEQRRIFDSYFALFSWHTLPKNAVGFDLGCGAGRWAYFVAPRVKLLHCIDPSEEALKVAKEKLNRFQNCRFHLASANANPLLEGSCDFGYALGVLHHVPDTQEGIDACVKMLKPGAPLLLYLYYDFDNRHLWYRLLWRITDIARVLICRLPFAIKLLLCDMIALFVYWPISRFARICECLHVPLTQIPLAAYRKRSVVFMRNDSLDRFGTRLERRFNKAQIEAMMRNAGLEHVRFGDSEPFWCAIGYKQ